MTKKKIERVSLSGTGSNRPKSSIPPVPQDPISRMAMKISVFEIEPYHQNPRTVTNEYYDEIKESIRQKGVEQSFSITRRPGDLKYTIRAGGNTRLLALQELYNETKDQKYLMIDVFFEPYTKEQDLLVSHLVENDLRGHLTLLDRAKGVSDARKLIEDELGRKLSNRELSEALKENGYSLGHTAIGILLYALNDIYPIIPELLEEGAGRAIIERVRKTENQLKLVWKELGQAESGFKKVFNESLKEALKHSKTSMDIDELFRAFETEMTLETGIDINKVRLQIAAGSQFKPTPVLPPVPDIEQDKEPEFNPIQDNTVEKPSDTQKENAVPLSDTSFVETLADELLANAPEEADSEIESYHENDSDLIEDIELLRKAALKEAILLAEEAEILDLVIKVNRGYGFALADMPREIHFPNGINDEHPLFQKIWQVWYQLYTVCGATLDLETTRYIDIIPYKNDLAALLELDFEAISDLGQYITTAALRANVLIFSSPYLFKRIEQLVKVIRQLNESADKQGINLWRVEHGE